MTSLRHTRRRVISLYVGCRGRRDDRGGVRAASGDVRMSDFKSNEYASLLGGDRYEPHEENPMIGFRRLTLRFTGLCRLFRDGVRRRSAVRDTMGLTIADHRDSLRPYHRGGEGGDHAAGPVRASSR